MRVVIPSYVVKRFDVLFLFTNDKLSGDFFIRLESNIAINFVVCTLIFDVHFERGWDRMGVDWEFGVRCCYLSAAMFSFSSTVSSDSEVLESWCSRMCWIENRLGMRLRISSSALFSVSL